MSTRLDVPRSGAQTGWQAASPEAVGSGNELMNLATPGIYPPANPARSGAQQGLQRDLPTRWYDVRGARAVAIQITSFNVTGAPVIRINGSLDGVGSCPITFTNPATGVSSSTYTVPVGGTVPVPQDVFGTPAGINSVMMIIDAPWFQWMQVEVATAGSAGSAWLTVVRRS